MWRPMDKAPKDASLVLVKCLSSYHLARYTTRESATFRGPRTGWWASGGMREPMLGYDASDELPLDPIAWQPLED